MHCQWHYRICQAFDRDVCEAEDKRTRPSEWCCSQQMFRWPENMWSNRCHRSCSNGTQCRRSTMSANKQTKMHHEYDWDDWDKGRWQQQNKNQHIKVMKNDQVLTYHFHEFDHQQICVCSRFMLNIRHFGNVIVVD